MRKVFGLALGAVLAAFAYGCAAAGDGGDDPAARHIYPTYGVHNAPKYSPCQSPDCLFRRGPGEPSDPLYPLHWSSEWTMYRVFNNYETYPPPYESPPRHLKEGRDYAVSYGATYYDSTYQDENGTGAMMEFYKARCLPIFPIDNDFTCAFISLGDKAYFLTYADRPEAMPPCCRFSDQNHPPRRDFVKHLPYSAKDSARLDDRVQAYSMRVGPGNSILFGYAFERAYTPDAHDKSLAPYRHPQSFYFSGYPKDPPNAPIVSQNYRNFSARKPDPKETWDQVAKQCKGEIPWCCLFRGDCPETAGGAAADAATGVPDWTTAE